MSEPASPFVESLDALFASAMEAERKSPSRPAMRNARPEPAKPLQTSERYTLAENWIPHRHIALMHEETRTLLGNFLEYSHKYDKGCRRLVREDGPAVVDCMEYVSGPQWVFAAKDIPSPATATSTREILLPELALEHLGVVGSDVALTVFMQYAGIIRAELCSHTTFHSPDNRTVITFPTGTNVYACMGLDSKIAVRRELSV